MSIPTETDISAVPPGVSEGPAAVENLQGRAIPDDPSAISYSYDAEGRLVGVLHHLGRGSARFTPIRPPEALSPSRGAVAKITEPHPLDPRVRIELDLPAGVLAVALGIAEETREPLSDVVLKAIAVYKLALDAKRTGLKVAIVDADWQIDREITGF